MKMQSKFFFSNNVLSHLDNKNLYKYKFLLIIILLVIIIGFFYKITFFKFFLCYYVFLGLLYILKRYVILNKYFKILLSESNLSIRLIIPIITCIFINYNMVLICLIKFLFIILIRLYFIEKLSLKCIIFTFIFCICTSFVSPVTSIYSYELFVFHMNPSNSNNNSNFWIWMRPQNETGLPDIHNRAQQLGNNAEQELKELQEYLKTTEHGINYNEIIPAEPNDFNIAKANNAFYDIQKKAQSFPGRVEIAGKATKLLEKIKNDEYINDGSPIHSKFTYNELSILKFFGKHFHLENTPGYNGVVQRSPFTSTEPNNIEITKSISSKSIFGKNFETEVYYYRKNMKAQLKAMDSKVWVLD